MKQRLAYKDLSEDQKHKSNARSLANVYQRRGVFEKQPCEICGDPKAEKHHPDYSKPLEFNWLCRKHHVDHHYGPPELRAPQRAAVKNPHKQYAGTQCSRCEAPRISGRYCRKCRADYMRAYRHRLLQTAAMKRTG